MRTTTTTPLCDYAPFGADESAMARAAERAAVLALRRLPGTDGAEWNRTGGNLIDSTRLAARAALPGARVFGRRADERGARPACGVTVLIDHSGSMAARDGQPITRAQRAAAVCCGIVRGCSSCGVPVTVARHTTACDDITLSVYEDSEGIVEDTTGAPMAGNRDALAVAALVARVPFAAPRGVFVLIADGEPTDAEGDHRAWAMNALAAIQRRGYAFVYAFVGSSGDLRSLDRARREWGAARVANCTANTRELARAMIAAAARVR
jgi:hypothetical protein